MPNHRSLRVCSPVLLLLLVSACAHGGGAGAPQAPASAMALDGAVVLAAPDPLLDLAAYDADELFHLAGEADRNERVDDAIRIYERLLADFPDSDLADEARFNLGLLHESRQHFQLASVQYGSIVALDEPSDDHDRRTWLDAHYRLAVCLGKLGQWWPVAEIFDVVLALAWLPEFDRLEAMVGRGIALQEAGDTFGAELQFAAVLRFYREASRDAPLNDRGLAAEAAFRMGDLAREQFDAVVLEFPHEVLTQRLEEKCALLLSAQSRYLRAIQLGDAHTVAAAGYRIGSLYESLYDVIVGLTTPAELTEEQGDIYEEEVRKRVMVLVEKAIQVYEKSLNVGRRAETAADWVTKMERALDRLKSIYLAAEAPLASRVDAQQPGMP